MASQKSFHEHDALTLQDATIWYNRRMNEDKNMFAEMLGMKRQTQRDTVQAARPVDSASADANDTVDELDVQKEVVEEMAREKAMLEESRDILEAEKKKLEEEKLALEEKVASLEGEVSRLMDALDTKDANNPELAALRAENAALEVKLARMGRSLMAARRAAAEASKVEIGGRRW